MAVNASIANNPRWLWETVAQYESGSFVDPTMVEDLRASHYPSIADLDQSPAGPPYHPCTFRRFAAALLLENGLHTSWRLP